MLTIANAAQGDAEACREGLIGEVGTIATGSAERDNEGFADLKKLSLQ